MAAIITNILYASKSVEVMSEDNMYEVIVTDQSMITLLAFTIDRNPTGHSNIFIIRQFRSLKAHVHNRYYYGKEKKSFNVKSRTYMFEMVRYSRFA